MSVYIKYSKAVLKKGNSETWRARLIIVSTTTAAVRKVWFECRVPWDPGCFLSNAKTNAKTIS